MHDIKFQICNVYGQIQAIQENNNMVMQISLVEQIQVQISFEHKENKRLKSTLENKEG